MCSAPFLRALVRLSAPSLLGRMEPTRLSNQPGMLAQSRCHREHYSAPVGAAKCVLILPPALRCRSIKASLLTEHQARIGIRSIRLTAETIEYVLGTAWRYFEYCSAAVASVAARAPVPGRAIEISLRTKDQSRIGI